MRSEPGLTRTFTVLNHLFNMLANNPDGAEGPDVADRVEGYLFDLAWVGARVDQPVHQPGRARHRPADHHRRHLRDVAQHASSPSPSSRSCSA